MHEPAVTLTDYLLAAECGLFALLLARRPPAAPASSAPASTAPWATPSLRRRWIAFFAALGLSAAAGGTYHGFLPDPGFPRTAAWRLTMLALGAAAVAAWGLGARLLFGPDRRTAAWVEGAAALAFTVYAVAVVVGGHDRFEVAVGFYLPAAVFLLAALAVAWRRRRRAAFGLGIAGLALTFVASGLQQAGVGLHPVWFDHNAVYHLVEAAALALLFLAARALVAGAGGPPEPATC